MADSRIDISEDELLNLGRDILQTLLTDRTTGRNIIWGTDDYAYLGEGYSFNDEITIEKITGDHGKLILPRVLKTTDNQRQRSKDKAEVFTPSWICNKQNNLVDNAWFGREDVFNEEVDFSDGQHAWNTKQEKIEFPNSKGKTWLDYVKDTRMEITCGEAPYLCSRYDTTTGEPIAVKDRIGLLDRKLRIVFENTTDYDNWHEMTLLAFKNIYGFEWQGDNLLLAREALLLSFIEYYEQKFNKQANTEQIQEIANIISWNIWQMDGLKFCTPGQEPLEADLFSQGNLCRIMDWETNNTIEYKSLLKS